MPKNKKKIPTSEGYMMSKGGMHKMPDGDMMKDSEMKKMMKKKEMKKMMK